MAAYHNERVRLTPIQETMCSTPEYDAFRIRFESMGISEWVYLNDNRPVERAFLRLGENASDSDMRVYHAFLRFICDNLDADMYWTWVLFDVYQEVQMVNVKDVLSAYNAFRGTFAYLLIITQSTTNDVDREMLVEGLTNKVKEIRTSKLEQVVESWIMEKAVYTSMAQWLPIEIIDHLMYSVLKCSV